MNLVDGLNIYDSGVKVWCKNGIFHREDGPALIELDGSEKWFIIAPKKSLREC